MAKRTAGEAVSIVGVATYESREDIEKKKKQQDLVSYSVTSGSVYAIGLAYPPPGILPPDESAVAALAVAPGGELFGATSGKQAHLFCMEQPLQVGDLGVIEGVKQVAESLVLDAAGTLYGASCEKGGPVFSCYTPQASLGRYNLTLSPVKQHAAPFKDDSVAGLAISCDKSAIAGISERAGRLFLMNPKTAKIRLLPAVAKEGEAFSRVLGAAGDNHFYGSGPNGQLFKMSPEGDVEWLPRHLPCRRGKAYLTRAASFVLSRSGRLYGGTEDGYLFSFNPAASELRQHGRGNDIPGLHALAEGADGAVYGITGRGEWASHLVRFRPDQGEWADLGLFDSYGHYPWTGYNVGALVAGRAGPLYAGERDRFGHLFIYHPPVNPLSRD